MLNAELQSSRVTSSDSEQLIENSLLPPANIIHNNYVLSPFNVSGTIIGSIEYNIFDSITDRNDKSQLYLSKDMKNVKQWAM